MIEVIADLTKRSQGNPGAMKCLVDLISRPPEELMGSIHIIQRLDELEILGTDIYVFWNDLAAQDFQVMEHLARYAPENLLKEACSRQDRSGIQLVEEWIRPIESQTKT